MMEESPLIQGVSLAYIEKVIFESCLKRLEHSEISIKPVLEKNVILYSLNAIQKDLAWFLTNGIINNETASKVLINNILIWNIFVKFYFTILNRSIHISVVYVVIVMKALEMMLSV
jgi:hypothetical protein